MAEERGIALVRDGEHDLTALFDHQRLLRVFANLIGNALKFCRPGDTVTLGARRDGDRITFSVTDSGPGIPPETLPFLFEPYWSSDGKRGSGLGLSIARGIVEAHGGTIWVDSAPRAGARFTFTLPAAPP